MALVTPQCKQQIKHGAMIGSFVGGSMGMAYSLFSVLK